MHATHISGCFVHQILPADKKQAFVLSQVKLCWNALVWLFYIAKSHKLWISSKFMSTGLGLTLARSARTSSGAAYRKSYSTRMGSSLRVEFVKPIIFQRFSAENHITWSVVSPACTKCLACMNSTDLQRLNRIKLRLTSSGFAARSAFPARYSCNCIHVSRAFRHALGAHFLTCGDLLPFWYPEDPASACQSEKAGTSHLCASPPIVLAW